MKATRRLLLLLPLAGCAVDWSLAKRDDAGASVSEPVLDAEIALEMDASGTSVEPEAEDTNVDAGSEDSASEPSVEDPDDAGSEPAADRDADAADMAPDSEAPVRDAAIATASGPCAIPLELACTEHNAPQKLACVSGVWTFNGSCDGQARCDTRFGGSQGTCQQIPARCVGKRPGDPFCDGLERKVCGADLLDELPAPCGANAHCDPSNAGCVCDRGFALDQGGACQDIVDCPSGACSPGGRCVDRVEAFECACDAGYLLASDKKSCVDIDDCKDVSCGPGGTCHDRVNGYECSCAAGYTLAADKKSCSDVTNDCPAADTCSPGTCVDRPNGYTCQCVPGTQLFEIDGASYCIDPCSFPCACGCG